MFRDRPAQMGRRARYPAAMLPTRFLARRRSAALLVVLAVTLLAAALPVAAAPATKKAPAIQAPPRPYSFLLNYTDQLG
ncbi:MAG: hypothetical protein QOH11_2259, partial [Solirubrobacteraceae bacterium]|nr:hypothetical protein [Solirubrobacteraceae bacterium]